LGIGCLPPLAIQLCRRQSHLHLCGNCRLKPFLHNIHPSRTRKKRETPSLRANSRIAARLSSAGDRIVEKIHGLLVHSRQQETARLDQAVDLPLPPHHLALCRDHSNQTTFLVSEADSQVVLPRRKVSVKSREISMRNRAEPPPAPTRHRGPASLLPFASLSAAAIHRKLLATYYPPKVGMEPGRRGHVSVISGTAYQAEAITQRDMVPPMQGVVHSASCIKGA